MLDESEIRKIEKIIGYTFENKELLIAAFCHISYANENGVRSNETLEFLGDSVLNFVVADIMFDKEFGDEGQMSVRRAEIVSRYPLAAEVQRLKLLPFLKLGSSFDLEKNMSPKFVSNLYEAVAAAIYKDSGLPAVKDFIKRTLLTHLAPVKPKDYKTKLQELTQSKQQKVTYKDRVVDENPFVFASQVFVDGELFGEGIGNRKKTAQQAAAKVAIGKLSRRKKQ